MTLSWAVARMALPIRVNLMSRPSRIMTITVVMMMVISRRDNMGKGSQNLKSGISSAQIIGCLASIT